MDEKTKELIAIGASVTAHCVPCIEHHHAKARELGLSDFEIGEAIKVGRRVRRGAANEWDKTANKLIREEFTSETSSANTCCAG